ncbi:MAG: hypothetical protein JST51_09610 [Armatimonadetes bacterium]|nr:hypothetical protein [Armatimonadota bacterium]
MKTLLFPFAALLICGCNAGHDKYDMATDQAMRNGAAKKANQIVINHGSTPTMGKTGAKQPLGSVISDDNSSGSGAPEPQ